ncbi:hypothetical protein LOK49_LG01G00277 [Camellia lanceoleosa]|uniref:Uncharacterized protein n=1 Tax=Camellia lanceoleosa TaxID=1840588 RepID=A0ACC0J658_9ERIC|nr:hypothetical protein LOK49_LG01G00277 [Camellia lanceoleosa]
MTKEMLSFVHAQVGLLLLFDLHFEEIEIAAIEASKILEKSSDQDLVLQHIGWIADVDQALAVRVLTSKRTD